MKNLEKSCWKPTDLNLELSPYTGLTRKHWIDCAKYILEKPFRKYVSGFNDLMKFPKVAGKTYPQPGAPEWCFRAANLESIRRTSYLAFPLIHTDKNITLNGINLPEYYKYHITRLLKHDGPDRIPYPSELDKENYYQFTCELGGLCMELLCFPDVIWSDMTSEEKDIFANMVSKWAHAKTRSHNWRYFNVMMLTFLKKHGYPVDDDLLKMHLYHLLSLHGGDGWMHDGHYDYYSIYVFNVYGAIWCKEYGYENEPEIAGAIEEIIVRMLKTSFGLYGRDGYIPMWGRSIIYRFSAVAGLPLAYFLNKKIDFNAGWARRICSGALLQFTTRDDFYYNDIPSLGYYGYREYCVQSYSSAGSPFSMFIPYICLALNEESPFWSEVENEGEWETMEDDVKVTELKGPGIISVQYGQTGTAELHAGKVEYPDQNYNKLCYNTHFPWEDEDLDNVSAMQYILKRKTKDENDNISWKAASPARIYYVGIRNSVIYRQIAFDELYANTRGDTIDLAEIILPYGVLRIDRIRLGREYELQLGHFGLPHIKNKPKIQQSKIDDNDCIIISNMERQLAFVTLNGWDKLDYIDHSGKNSETTDSTVCYAARKRESFKDTSIDLLISIMLHKTDNNPWQENELMPVKKIKINKLMQSGSVYGAEVELKSGEQYIVDFSEIDGCRSM